MPPKVKTGGSTTAAPGGVGPVAKASLTPDTGSQLVFHFNPEKIGVKKKAATEGSRGMVANSFQDAVKASGNLTIKLSDVHFTGPATKAVCDMLISWATPIAVPGTGRLGKASGSSAGGTARTGATARPAAGATTSQSATKTPGVRGSYAGKGTIYKLPLLTFSWGGGGGSAGMTYRVVLENVDITYKRFSSAGAPVWATVSLDLKEFSEEPKRTNPSSGGVTGRTKHVMTAGEGVILVASRTYGTPAAWRAIAEANRLDDPLRVKPGRLLDLPAPTELEEI